VSDQYSQYTVIDDIKINGKLTLGEDLADLGGTWLAYLAWKSATKDQDLQPIDGFTPDQRFFIGMAQWACGDERPESKRMNAITNEHSPDEYRINGVVSNMPEFGKAFACRVGQPMVVEAPGGVGDFVAQLRLGGDGGLLLVEKLLDVALVGFGVLGGQDGRVGSETMAQRVERRTLLARFDARTGRVLGVGAVGGGATFQPALDGVRCCGGCWSLGCCCHFVLLGHWDSTGGDGIEGWAAIVC
jgi:hypothetical protein